MGKKKLEKSKNFRKEKKRIKSRDIRENSLKFCFKMWTFKNF